MKMSYGHRTLENAGYALEYTGPVFYRDGKLTHYPFLSARKGNYEIELWRDGNSDECAHVRVRNLADKDEPESDYVAGRFAKSLRQAMAWVAVQMVRDYVRKELPDEMV